MKKKTPILRIIPYVSIITIIALGLWVSYGLDRFEFIAKAILGFAVFYYAYLAYKYRGMIETRAGDDPTYFKFPRNINDVIDTLLLAIVLSLAFQDLIDLVIWLRNKF
jgi:hypothetical protein